MKNKNGFTLAEVLITLVIIGVIAAITVPTLNNKTQNEEYVSKLKKANSVLNQAVHTMAENNGFPQGDYSFLRNNDVFYREFVKVVNVNEKCNTIDSCMLTSQYKTLNNNNIALSGDEKAVSTSDNIAYSYYFPINNTFGISAEDKSNLVGRILVDINGNKKPNKYGRDVFFFYLVNKKGIIPAGIVDYSDCVTNQEGKTCAARILRENAMNY